MRSAQVFWRQIRTSLNEAFGVECDATIKPTRIRGRTGHDENARDLVLLSFLRFIVSPANGFEVIASSFKAYDLCVRMKYDIRTLFDPTNQIARHILSQRDRPN